MSIESIQSRIADIESRLAALAPTPPPVVASGPVQAGQMLGDNGIPGPATPFNVALGQAQGQVRLRPASGTAAYDDLIRKYAGQYGVDPAVVRAVMDAESDGNPRCTSNKGAMGLMQLMPEELKQYGITDPYDPEQNIRGGVQQLSEKLRLFNGDLRLALAAYNAGSGAVRHHGGIPPYPETQGYVRKILSALGRSE